jgi:hypothetical protein
MRALRLLAVGVTLLASIASASVALGGKRHSRPHQGHRDSATWDPEFYTAAATLHLPTHIEYGYTAREMIDFNLQAYDALFLKAKSGSWLANESRQIDIIVYPEGGTGFLFIPDKYIYMMCEPLPPLGWSVSNVTGCGAPTNASTMQHATWASCRAQLAASYVVINYCALNVSSGLIYNTDVAFDRSGAVVAVYRKSHITGTGPYIHQPVDPDPVTFRTDFNTTFGMFTCYDLWFWQPMREEMLAGVDAFLFPNEMASPAPYMTTFDAVVGWSMMNQVDVIASTSFTTGGAGIVASGIVQNQLQPNPLATAGASHVVVTSMAPPNITARKERRRAMMPWKRGVPVASPPVVNSTTMCKYAVAQLGWLNFDVGCEFFTADQAGSSAHSLSASYAPADGSIAVSCNATIFVDLLPPLSADTPTTWVLMALALRSATSLSTPSATATAGCILTACQDPLAGCMTTSASAVFNLSHTIASAVSVSARFSGTNVTSAVATGGRLDMFPFIGITNSDLSLNGTNLYRFSLSADELTLTVDSPQSCTVATDAILAGTLNEQYLASAGVWASAYSATGVQGN